MKSARPSREDNTGDAADTARTPGLSIAIIARNEEQNLARCLESVKFADEIVVFDTGSTDRTVELARSYTSHVLEGAFEGFGAAKRRAMAATTCTWVFSIDADEVVDAELRGAIQRIITVPADGSTAYRVNRKSHFLGRWMKHSGWYPDRVLRLGPGGHVHVSAHPVHEHLEFVGAIHDLPGHLLHYTDPDFAHYLTKLSRYAGLSARAMHAEGRRARAFDLFLRPPYQFMRTYLLQRGILDGRQGFILACGSAFHVFTKYVRLWDLERSRAECSS